MARTHKSMRLRAAKDQGLQRRIAVCKACLAMLEQGVDRDSAAQSFGVTVEEIKESEMSAYLRMRPYVKGPGTST